MAVNEFDPNDEESLQNARFLQSVAGGSLDLRARNDLSANAKEMKMSEKSTVFAGEVENVVRQFEAVVAEMKQLGRRDEKRMRDEIGGVYSVQSLTIFMGPMRLLLDPNGYDLPGCDGAIDLYLLPPYDPVATLYLEHGKWFLHSPDLTSQESIAHLTSWKRSALTRESIVHLLESIAKHAVPSV